MSLNTLRRLFRSVSRRANVEDHVAVYHLLLRVLLSQRTCLNIVVVGANDGLISDPLYEFIVHNASNTRILLAEPQKSIVTYLRRNYRFHPRYDIFEGAIAPGDITKLYTIKEEYWDLFYPAYAKGWPRYRAPTGICSAEIDNVKRWIRMHYKGTLSPSQMIEELLVPCSDLQSAIQKAGLFNFPDVLQIDTEGFDDQVIYCSNIVALRPALIFFELELLPSVRREKVLSFLLKNGYHVEICARDAIAIRDLRHMPTFLTSDTLVTSSTDK